MPAALAAEKLREWEESSAAANRSTKLLDEWEMDLEEERQAIVDAETKEDTEELGGHLAAEKVQQIQEEAEEEASRSLAAMENDFAGVESDSLWNSYERRLIRKAMERLLPASAFQRLLCSPRRRRRRAVPKANRVKVSGRWSGGRQLSTDAKWYQNRKAGRTFGVSGKLLSARLLKRSIQVKAELYNRVEVSGPTDKSNALITDVDLSNSLTGGINLYVSGKNIFSLVEIGEYQAEKTIELMPPICMWVYAVTICVRVGAVAEQTLDDGAARDYRSRWSSLMRKYVKSAFTGKLGFYASGTVHAWIVEARVRAMGTLMSVGLESKLETSWVKKWRPRLCGGVDVVVRNFGFENAVQYRTRSLRYHGRRRWWGRVSWGWGGWRNIFRWSTSFGRTARWTVVRRMCVSV
jgi:hypothetical protein